MGAWDIGHFDNDSALDWMHDFLESENQLDLLMNTLNIAKGKRWFFNKLFRKNFELDEPEATAILAAGEIISIILGKPPKYLPEDLENWVENNQLTLDKNIVNDALNAVRTVREHSELRLLWEEAGELNKWLEEVKNLELRLVIDS
ncbi:DUF4259 domain-containing protein [Lysinibacillus sp. BW-2-10]|uniref:DUF4259 domain-containing protein n=1 Tax=Lysinibacillus sp. BW-2-10 TaxID=2590030 RepID=UPI00117E2CE0|nr:DUF4259 domain-containing protein [Lysinibacillus sp. BW-2-10]TSI03896.1 DUF4259 domain-containing protein [Lysinibacillus sp. BW-2-10]